MTTKAPARKSKGSTRKGKKPKRGPAPKWSEDKFFEALVETGTVRDAAKKIRISADAIYKRRREHPDFAARWEQYEERRVEHLEQVAYKRASEGSDRMIEFLLKSAKPDRYGDKLKIDDQRKREREIGRLDEDELNERLTGIENVVPIEEGKKAA